MTPQQSPISPSVNVADLNQFETTDMSVIEVCVLWETYILHVSHINQNESFVLTSENVTKDCNHFIVESDVIGNLKELPVVVNGYDGAKLITEEGERLIEQGKVYEAQFGNLKITAKQVAQGKKLAYATKHDKTMIATHLCSAFIVFAMMFITNIIVGHSNDSLLMQANQDDRLNELRAFIQRQQERQLEEQAPVASSPSNIQQGASSAAHSGPSGRLGSRQAPSRNTRHAIRNNNEPPHLTREAARNAVANRGIFVALGGPSAVLGGNSGIVSPFGGLTESGLDTQNANGNLNGDSAGDSFGYNGLGSSGTGWGANGTQENIVGVGDITTRGNRNGETYGIDRGTRLRSRGNRGPIVRPSAPTVVGLLSPDSIRRIVLRNLAQVTHCHEQGLIQNPTLSGRVVIRFVIGGQGTILGSSVSESSLAIPSVSECISNAVRRWQFPAPEGGGVVTVNYPFTLQQPE